MDLTIKHKEGIRGKKDRFIQPVFILTPGQHFYKARIINTKTGKDITYKFRLTCSSTKPGEDDDRDN